MACVARSAWPSQTSTGFSAGVPGVRSSASRARVASDTSANGTPRSSPSSSRIARAPPEHITAPRPPRAGRRGAASSASVAHHSSTVVVRATPYARNSASNAASLPAIRPAWLSICCRERSLRPGRIATIGISRSAASASALGHRRGRCCRLEVDPDHPRLGERERIADQVGDADRDLLAGVCGEAEPDPRVEVVRVGVRRAGLRDERDRPRPHVHRRRPRHRHAAGEVHEAQGVRPEQGDAARRDEAPHLVEHRCARRVGDGGVREHERRPGARRDRVLQLLRHARGGTRDHRQVDGAGQLAGLGEAGPALDLVVGRRDGVDRPAEGRRPQRREHRVPRSPGSSAGADHGDRGRLEQRAEPHVADGVRPRHRQSSTDTVPPYHAADIRHVGVVSPPTTSTWMSSAR